MNSHCDCKIGVNCWLLLYYHTVLMHITVSIHCTATGQKHSTQLIQHCHEKKRWKDQPFMSYHQPQYLRYEIAYNWVREQLVVFQLAKWIQRRSMSQQSLQCSQKNKGLVTCCHTQTHTHTFFIGILQAHSPHFLPVEHRSWRAVKAPHPTPTPNPNIIQKNILPEIYLNV